MPPTRWKREEEEEGEANHRQTLNSLTPSRLQTAPPHLPVQDRWAPLTLSLLLRSAKLLHPSLEGHGSQRRAGVPIGPMHTLPGAPSPSTAAANRSSPPLGCPSSGTETPSPPGSHALTAPAAALQLPQLQPSPALEPAGWKHSFGVTGAGNPHRHPRVTAGAKGTLVGVPPAGINTLSLLTGER